MNKKILKSDKTKTYIHTHIQKFNNKVKHCQEVWNKNKM